MKNKERYSIGDVSRICNISKKALRHYDKIGLIRTGRKDHNNYRYYTKKSILSVPVIKYYKQMGFTLEEMKDFIEGNISNVYSVMQRSFKAKIVELEKAQEQIRRRYVSVKDWYDLIVEAEMVLENAVRDVSIKYVEPAKYLFQEQNFENDIAASIINIDFTNYVESLRNEITGPVIIRFSSYRDRMGDREQRIRIMQKTLLPCPENLEMKFGGSMMLACYHIGPFDNIGETYKKMSRWARNHRYALGGESYERYVTDYWTTRNSSQFVTEIMMPIYREKAAMGGSHQSDNSLDFS